MMIRVGIIIYILLHSSWTQIYDQTSSLTYTNEQYTIVNFTANLPKYRYYTMVVLSTIGSYSGGYLIFSEWNIGGDEKIDVEGNPIGACTACPPNLQSVVGSAAATSCVCNLGFTGPNCGTCAACAAGKYKPATGSAACTDCDVNKYSTATGATAVGTCQSCPTSSQSTPGSDAATDCQCNAGTCVYV